MTPELRQTTRDAFRRFFEHVGEPWPAISDDEADRLIELAARIDSLEAQRQQHRMRPVEFRVRMFKLLLDAQPSDAGEREAFMAGVDRCGAWIAECHTYAAPPRMSLRVRWADEFAAWKASQQPPAPREQEPKA